MPSPIRDSIPTLWNAVSAKLETGLREKKPPVGFFGLDLTAVHRTNRAVVALERTVTFDRLAVNQVQATLTVRFGCMVRSGERAKGKEEAEELSYWLADLFLADPSLEGLARDTRVESIELDAGPLVDDGQPADWASVTVAWETHFSRV